ncbi:MAG: type I DNA topoisomerase [Candidatus Nealsonbacteria bacterium]|nr:type I DNA topoisomerase [Candidatus Nealsonbacteria bacterium]
MTKRAAAATGKSLVIVESPAKARTIGKFLGSGFTIEASIGHIRDLPQGAKEIPERYKGEDWAYLGVNVNEGFEPVYVVPKGKSQQVSKLKALLKGAKDLYLATDEDREGEAISWHLCEVLKPKVPVYRLVFHEITKEAIHKAMDAPREIDVDLVRAQEVRRIVDRLYGYDVSPLLWRKIRPRLSAGRVQSVAVRLIVERERLRMAFVSATYWDLLGTFIKAEGQSLDAMLVSVDGRKAPSSRDFDSATGKLKNPSLLLLNEAEAVALAQRLQDAPSRVASLEDKPYTTRPYPPFTTSTLQQEANRKCGFTARHTMQVAQSLYENGHITYMRTDSTNLATVAVDAARDLVASQYGSEYLPDGPRTYQTKVKNAQEAHEAIRPAGSPFGLPEDLRAKLSPDEFKLYDMIWKRTVASQMTDARGRRITITIETDGVVFQVSGKTIEFPGYLRAYVEGSDDPEAELADRDDVLPSVAVDEVLTCRKLEAKGHTTKPPNRYSEASLTRALEEMGIGRPSTYASIIDTILARQYVFKIRRGNVLVPTWTAFAVSSLLESHLPDLVDYKFTAEMEDELDAISRGELGHVEYLKQFYFGNTHPGLKDQLKNKIDEIDAREVCQIRIGKPEGDGPESAEIFVRVGRYGPFIQQDERRASLPENMPPDELTIEAALELLAKAAIADEPLGVCPDTHKPVFVKIGRFGPYVQLGTPDDDEKPKNASLLKGMEPEDIDVALALKLLSLPRTLGDNPTGGEPVVAHNGRFGPYVKCGDETRSLGQDVSPLDVTLPQALELLAQPKARRGQARRKEPIKQFDPSPVTNEPVLLLEGRYGPYVTDGQTNASLPRGTSPEEVTLDYALQLLKARAEKGPTTKKKSTKKKAAKKKTTKKKAAKKKPAKKKTAKKKSAKT